MTDTILAAYDLPPIPDRLTETVVIVGFADGHRDHADWGQEAEFWGLNRLHAVLEDKPWTRWFELHSLENFYGAEGPRGFDEEHVTFLREFGGPVYIRPQDLNVAEGWGIPNAVPYPIERIMQSNIPYFTNSVSWLLALAIGMEFKQIQMFGVDMAQDTLVQAEYAEQRPSCEYFLGLAVGKGIDIVLPPGSDLLKSNALYGFTDDVHRDKLLARLQELGQRKENIRGEMQQKQAEAAWLQSRISELDGAMQEVQYNTRNLMTPKAEEAT
jgi:hypothetical protein